MALIKEYFVLTLKYQEEYGPNTIVLMQVGSFFEVYGVYEKKIDTITGSRLIEFSQICELNIVEKNTCIVKENTDRENKEKDNEKNNVMMAGFKDIQIEKYIKKIQEAGFTAVVYVQDDSIKNTTRSLGGIFSPGTYFHTDTQTLTNSITCIWIELIENRILLKGKYVVVGVANIDIYTGKTSIFQFKEVYLNNPSTYDELERFISIYKPSEVILISNLPDEKEMDYIVSYAGINCSLIHKIHVSKGTETERIKRIKNCEKQTYQMEILSKFYNLDDTTVFMQNFYDNHVACQSFCFLLDFVCQHNPNLVNKILEPVFENCTDRLILANHSLKQLNIVNDGNVKSGKYSSVCNLLNECLTPMGKRKFEYTFLNPTCDAVYLQKEYDITEHFLKVYDEYNLFLKNKLGQFKDISKWERQIFIKKISPKSFFQMYKNLAYVIEVFKRVTEDATILQYLQTVGPETVFIHEYCSEINGYIEKHLNLDLCKDFDNIQNFETNFINHGIDAELDKKTEIFRESEMKLASIQNYLNTLIEGKEKGHGKKTEYVKIHETEKNNLGLICTVRRCKLLVEALPKDPIIVSLQYNGNKKFDFKISKKQFNFEKQSSSNNFIEDDQISTLCRNISTIKISMKDLVLFTYNRFVTQFEKYQSNLEGIIQFVTHVDLLYTKATLAKKYNYCKPTIVSSEKSFVNASNLRHCLIEQFQNNEIYVSNDISLGLGNGTTDGILLYGTNAVGKTSFIKSIGISVIMAQSGLYVPASSYDYQPYRYIFTRIIGNDNIFKGQSTFAVEMSELRTILRRADENSLILGDELCSGTEIMSAISIFVAGIQQLHSSKSSFIFATHLHEVVDYEEIQNMDTVSLKHMEVTYDRERDLLIYDRKLKDGPGNSMYGLEVCKSLNLPQDFLDNAYSIRMKYHNGFGNKNGESILSLKTSAYNSKKLVNMCEKCKKKPGKEVHHLTYQSEADEDGIIKTKDAVFHKNHIANLMTLCEDCHDTIHRKNEKLKKVKTSKGTVVKGV